MKKLKTILLILLTIPSFGQWIQQTSGTTEILNDVFCVTENFVVAVGDNGTILKTTDGGTTWVQKTSGINKKLLKVQFVSPNVGYIISANSFIGDTGKLLKTNDGGESWSVLNYGESLFTYIFDFSSVNENVLYLSTKDGYLLKTIDGGVSFQEINTSLFIQNIQFINEMVGFASGNGGLIKTIDGGVSWIIIGNVDLSISNQASFYFFNETLGFVKRSNELYKTIDGGVSYTYLSNINYYMPKLFASNENVIWGMTVDLLLNGQPNFTMRGEIATTGAFLKVDADYPLFKSIHFVTPTKGYGVGWEGIYKNSTGTMLGVNEIDKKNTFTIYPNPTTEQITITFNEIPKQPFSVELIDTLGKKVFTKIYYQNNITINTKTFSKGVYILSIINNKKKQTQKLIIN